MDSEKKFLKQNEKKIIEDQIVTSRRKIYLIFVVVNLVLSILSMSFGIDGIYSV